MNLAADEKTYLRQIIQEYLKTVPDASAEEKAALREWVLTKHSPYDNPWFICGENGYPLDYIAASRFWEDIDPPEIVIEDEADPFV